MCSVSYSFKLLDSIGSQRGNFYWESHGYVAYTLIALLGIADSTALMRLMTMFCLIFDKQREATDTSNLSFLVLTKTFLFDFLRRILEVMGNIASLAAIAVHNHQI